MASRYLHQPREVSIETLALCNARCTFCPYPILERHGTKLSDADIASLIQQMKAYKEPFFISPFKVNEPFLDYRLLTICKWIEEDLPLARLRIFTNGSRFTRDNVQELLALRNVEHIWISLNEVDPIRYRETMGYVAFEHVAEKIDILHAAFVRGTRGRVLISRVSEGRHPSSNGKESERRLGFDQYVIKRWPCFVPFTIKRDGWLGFVEPQNSEIPSTPCARWEELNICATGDVALCCMDGKGEFKLGNIRESSLDEIYNQPTLVRRRLGMIERKRIEPCNRCTY